MLLPCMSNSASGISNGRPARNIGRRAARPGSRVRRRVTRALLPLVLVLAGGSGAALAQQKVLTLDDLYAPGTAIRFGGSPPTGLVWLNDTHYLWPRDNGGTEWLKVEASTGQTEPLFDPKQMAAALAALPGITADEAGRVARRRAVTFNPAYSALVTAIADDLYFYDIASGTAKRLTYTPGTEEEAAFSPDGKLVGFVRDADLHVVDPATQGERALTTDGGPARLNGKLDWVYQEEIYGRGTFRAYWWSPDSSQIAFLQLDETPVPEYTIVDDIPYQPTVETWDYPKAGDPNPIVRLGVVGAAGGPVRWADTGKYSSIEFLIVNVAWTPDGPGGGLPGAEPRADLARPEPGRSHERRVHDDPAGDEQDVGGRKRESDAG